MTCTWLTSGSLTFMNKGNLKLLKACIQSFDPFFSLQVSWRIGRSFSSLTPSNLASGDYSQNDIKGQTDGKDRGVHWGKDIEPNENIYWV